MPVSLGKHNYTKNGCRRHSFKKEQLERKRINWFPSLLHPEKFKSQQVINQGWSDGLAAKSTCCSIMRTRTGSQHPHFNSSPKDSNTLLASCVPTRTVNYQVVYLVVTRNRMKRYFTEWKKQYKVFLNSSQSDRPPKGKKYTMPKQALNQRKLRQKTCKGV